MLILAEKETAPNSRWIRLASTLHLVESRRLAPPGHPICRLPTRRPPSSLSSHAPHSWSRHAQQANTTISAVRRRLPAFTARPSRSRLPTHLPTRRCPRARRPSSDLFSSIDHQPAGVHVFVLHLIESPPPRSPGPWAVFIPIVYFAI